MLTETYRKSQTPPEGGTVSASKEVESYQTQKEARQELLKRAGLHQRARREKNMQGSVTKMETAPVFFEELTGKQLRTWMKFLPTCRELDDYTFDAVPDDALEEIIFAKETGCFDRIVIWTPEGNSFLGLVARKLEMAKDKLDQLVAKLDPMAVGVVMDTEGKEHFFPIVRWGEALLPYKAIKRHVRAVHWKAKVLFGILPVMMALFGIAAYYNGIVTYGYGQMIGMTVLSALALVILGVIAVMVSDSSW